MATKVIAKMNQFICWLDRVSLWWLFFPLFAVVFAPFLVLGEGSVFEWYDQLDEVMMNYVLTARHLGEGLKVLPEMLGGINASGLQPAAVLFIPLYRVLPEFWAFVLQYAIIFAVAFFGMYFCARELTGSSILALVAAGCFCMLPEYPVYGLSAAGIPLVLYAFIRIWKGKEPWPSFLFLVLFGLTSHLVLSGYVVLGFWALGIVVSFLRKRKSGWLIAAFIALLAVYVAVNHSLFVELLLGQSSYVSHREEMVSSALPFWSTVWEIFFSSAQHVPSLHRYLILPITVALILGGIFLKRMEKETRLTYFMALGGC